MSDRGAGEAGGERTVLARVAPGHDLPRVVDRLSRAIRSQAMDDQVPHVVPDARGGGHARIEALLAAEPLGQSLVPAGIECHVAVLALTHRVVDARNVIPQPHGVAGAAGAKLGFQATVRAGGRLVESRASKPAGVTDPEAGEAE